MGEERGKRRVVGVEEVVVVAVVVVIVMAALVAMVTMVAVYGKQQQKYVQRIKGHAPYSLDNNATEHNGHQGHQT